MNLTFSLSCFPYGFLARVKQINAKKSYITWKFRVRLIENINITFSDVSKASFSFASLLRCVAQIPFCTESSRFSRLQLLTIKYLICQSCKRQSSVS